MRRARRLGCTPWEPAHPSAWRPLRGKGVQAGAGEVSRHAAVAAACAGRGSSAQRTRGLDEGAQVVLQLGRRPLLPRPLREGTCAAANALICRGGERSACGGRPGGPCERSQAWHTATRAQTHNPPTWVVARGKAGVAAERRQIPNRVPQRHGRGQILLRQGGRHRVECRVRCVCVL